MPKTMQKWYVPVGSPRDYMEAFPQSAFRGSVQEVIERLIRAARLPAHTDILTASVSVLCIRNQLVGNK